MKKLVLLLIVLMCVTSIFANGAQETEETIIRMWTFLDPANTQNGRSVALSQMIEEFEAENPGTKVIVEPQDYNIMTAKFLASTVSGDAPDIIWCSRDELSGVLNANALEPLDNLFLGDWSQEEINDISDVYIEFGKRDDKHYTLGLSKNSIGLYYRSDLLAEKGLALPTTYDELLEAAVALTETDEATGLKRYGLGQAFSTESADNQLIYNYIYDKQGYLFNDDGTAAWATDAGIEALNWELETIKQGATPREAANLTNEETILEFQAGKYAMLLLGAVRMPNIRAAASFDPSTIEFMEIPGGNAFDGWFVGVWAGSENKEMAGKFLEKMYSPKADELWVTLGGQAPLRKSTVENIPEFFEKQENQFVKVMAESFETAVPLSNAYTVNGVKFDLNRAVQNALNGKDVLESLEQAEKDFNTANGR